MHDELEHAILGRGRSVRMERPDPARRPGGHHPAARDASEVPNLQARSCFHSASQAAWTRIIKPPGQK